MMRRIWAFTTEVQFLCFALSKETFGSRRRCLVLGRRSMTERPSKRFKQSSLTDFSFSKQAKPASLQSSRGQEVITITDSEEENKTDMASSGHEHPQTTPDDTSSGQHPVIQSPHLKGDNQTSSSSSGVRKRPIADLSPTVGDLDAGFAESPSHGAEPDNCATGLAQTETYSLSPDLFTDSEPLTDSVDFEDVMERLPAPHSSQPMGTPLKELNRTPACAQRLPPLQVNESHTVLFQVPYQFDSMHPCIPIPFPDNYKDRWDGDHVRMPCSHLNEYPIMNKVRRRWELIEKALRGDLSDAEKLQKAILSYNTRYASKWDFSALHRLCNEEFTALEADKFFKTTVRNIANLALKLPHLCTQPIPLLKTDKTHGLTLSQQQISCLLANAFFCTFPRRNARGRNSEYSAYPDINFNSLFAGACHRKFEKLKCILHYFNRVADPSSVPLGTVTFTRQTLQQLPDWGESATCLRNLHVATDGKIEDEGCGMLQVDFANKFIGGGVLGRGCVQEEIRFMICPEMIVSRLFTEVLAKNECLIMTGCERFSNYAGYADSFRWLSDHIDCTERDEWGRCRTEVVGIDAMVIREYGSQFKAWCVKRELDKAYCGFYKPHTPINNLPAVCTGNWGCGAFGGEKQLKALIQLMAAAEAGRDVCYFTFDDTYLQKQLYDIHKFIRDEEKLCIGDVLKIIQQYYRNECADCPTRPRITLFNYIYQVFRSNQSSSDEEAHVGGALHKSTLGTTNSIDYKAETP